MESFLNNDMDQEFGEDWEENFINQLESAENNLNLTSHESNEDLPEREYLEVLLKCFGHKKFRPMQWKIIKSIIKEKRDNCAIMTTGYGKSLCYQYPSAYMGGLTIVISPLISLMEDQVLAMQVTNISACLLGSANTKQKDTIQEIFDGKYNLVYLTPEFCTGDCGKEILGNMNTRLSINLIAVDEAHCVSSWGHDFRFQYRNLGILKEIMPNVPILAVTATATPKVRDDIIEILKLKNPQILCSGFDRPNLFFSVHFKSGNIIADLNKCMKREGGEWKFPGPTIIYCITKKATEDVSQILSGMGIRCLPYHAGLSLSVRKSTHEQFLKDKVEVISATIAFGMGIDKPDIRNIIHYGSAKSIEGYYQEVGRAGRDGLPAMCTTFYSNHDFDIYRRIREESGSNKKHNEKMADLMLEYLRTRDCRRQFILSHFEDTKQSSTKSSPTTCCDNCIRKIAQPDNETYEDLDTNGRYDFTEDAKIFLEAVIALGGRFGMQNYVLFLRGSKSGKVSGFSRNHLLGSGKHKSVAWWKGLGALLEQEKYLEKQYTKSSTYSFCTINVSKKGLLLLKDLKNGVQLLLTPTPELFGCLKKKANAWLQSDLSSGVQQQPSTSNNGISNGKEKTNENDPNKKLYQLLMNKRYELANSQDCMPYLIATNKALIDMAKTKPTTLQQLRNCELDGFTEAKISKFGEEFLKTVRSYLNFDLEQPVQPIQDILILHPLSGAKVSVSAHASYSLFKSGLSVQEIADKRGVTAVTVVSHLIDAMKLGYPIKIIDLGVTHEIKEKIINTIKTIPTGLSLLTPIKNACPADITFNQIKTVVIFIQIRQHLKKLRIPYEEFDDAECNVASPSVTPIAQSDSPPPDSPGMLTQLIEAAEMCKNNPVSNEDSNFSEGIPDSDLAAVCESLETSLSQEDVLSDSACDEPPLKKSKSDDFDISSLLDSPPRLSATRKESHSLKCNEDVTKFNEKGECSTFVSQKSSKPAPKAAKSGTKLKLPPWLTTKRIA